MDIVYKASDPLDEFYRICDEQGEEMSLEARRKLFDEKDFSCVYCLYHEKYSGCMYRECPLTPDRVCCGCATIASAWRYMAIGMNHEKLLKRNNACLIKSFSLTFSPRAVRLITFYRYNVC